MILAQKNKFLPLVLALGSGVLMWLGWPPKSLTLLLFVGFVPLFYLNEHLSQIGSSDKKIFWYTYLGLFTFNVLTTWWVAYASVGGAIFMVFFDTTLMALPFLAYHKSKRIMGMRKALFAFIFYWMAIEYLHSHWQFSFPWLSMGNGMATSPNWVQWYEFTGVSGGSLWILGLNVMVFYVIANFKKVRLLSIALVLVLPIIFSHLILKNLPESFDSKEIVVVQPNVDPYEKFGLSNQDAQIESFLELAKSEVGPKTELVVLPETALAEHINEDGINRNRAIRKLAEFSSQNHGLKILTGASTHRYYKEGEKRSPTARKTSSGHEYESYNTALLIGPNGVEQKYHKSKLVPGVEKMPYPRALSFLQAFNVDLGGISGSLAMDPEPVVFGSDSFKYAPLICYESVFPDYANRFVQKGANLMFVITNDGWWDETDGHRQHKDYTRLRAIENRREVLRSANTGISCRIDVQGQTYQETNWWEKDVIKCNAKLYKGSTVFSRTGDGLGRVASIIAVFTILSVLVKSFTRKKNLV